MRHSHLLTVYTLDTIFSEGEALLLCSDFLTAPEKPRGEEQRVRSECCANHSDQVEVIHLLRI